jgi:hypothetical protein
MKIELEIAGILLIALSLLHIVFPKQFKWKDELSVLTLFNRQLFYVHTFFIALILFLMGLLCVTSADEIIDTSLGKKIAFGLFIFWLMRLLFQFFVYSDKLWKGKKIETFVHIIFSMMWLYFCLIFFLIGIK